MNEINQLFAKYQQPLLSLINTDKSILRTVVRRKLLGISDKEVSLATKIAGISNNAYAIQVGQRKYQATFRGYPVFAKRLHYALTSVDIAKNWFQERKRNIELYKPLPNYAGLLNYAGLTRDARFPNIMLASPESYYSHSGDGWIQYTGSGSWATTHDAAAGTAIDLTNASNKSSSELAGTYSIRRGFAMFDTSALPDTSTITGVDLSLYSAFKNSIGGTQGIVEALLANDVSPVVGDYDLIGSAVTNPTELATRVTTSTISAIAYTVFAYNAAGLLTIDKAGYTGTGHRDSYDMDNSAIGAGENTVYWYMSEQAGTANDPLLVVTYTLPSGGGSTPMIYGLGLTMH